MPTQKITGKTQIDLPTSVQKDGVDKGYTPQFNFVGNNVDVTVSGTVARISITGSGGGIAGGQYRQFVYAVMSGTFSFVVDISGSPVMALEDLE